MRLLTPRVYRQAARMLGPGPEAEDATQEVFMKMHRSFGSFDTTRPIEPWASRITYTTCLTRLGKTKRTPDAPAESDLVEGHADDALPDPEAVTSRREAGRLVTNALGTVSAQDRFLVDLRYRDGFTHAEIAESTGMPVGTVKTRLHRSRAALRKVLTPLVGRRTTSRTSGGTK